MSHANSRGRLEQAKRDANDPTIDAGDRDVAIALLAFHHDGAEHLTRLALESRDPQVRLESIIALAKIPKAPQWRRLWEVFPSESPRIRSEILNASLARTSRASGLLDAVRDGRIRATEIDRHHIDQLLEHRDEDVRSRAKQLFATVDTDREQVLNDYQSIFALASDATRGRAVFKSNCASCHRIGDVGVDVAPGYFGFAKKVRAAVFDGHHPAQSRDRRELH